jgi:hypothetical protein
MKNIHLLPTDKPSRLSILNSGKLNFGAEIMSSSNSKPQHIYITSDEEINEGDCVLFTIDDVTEIVRVTTIYQNSFESKQGFGYGLKYCKKIILTTDQDLDGVQAINDKFLEWFVKNPNCEDVEVEKQMLCDYCGQEHCDNLRCRGYKDIVWYEIIIPQEEPKQETLEEAAESRYGTDIDSIRGSNPYDLNLDLKKGFIEGAKWQADRMYSEEDMKTFGEFCADYNYRCFGKHTQEEMLKIWFEQFKKK